MKTTFLAALLVGLSLSLPAAAQPSITIGPGGVRVDPDGDRFERRYRDEISEREARRIARRNGIDDIWRVYKTRRNWVVSGEDHRGRFLRITIDEDTGRVVDIDRRRRG